VIRRRKLAAAFVLVTLVALNFKTLAAAADPAAKVRYKTAKVGDLDIFYREAGRRTLPRFYCFTGSHELADVPQSHSRARR